MEQAESKEFRPTNPHDRFCRRTVFHRAFAPDFLKSYADKVLLKYTDLDNLQEAPTTHLSKKLKEVILDASLTTRLLDAQSKTEVQFFLEHKSSPSWTAALQLLMSATLSLHSRWVLNRSESKAFVPPIPLMVVVYNGNDDWNGEIWFQNLFPHLPEELRPYVPQFRVFFINLRHFKYGNLPGRPETRAAVESLLRATDGTFAEHLPSVLAHVAESDLDEYWRLDLITSISSYCGYTAQASDDQIAKAISAVFKGQEGLKMIETIKSNVMLEGIAIGEARGIAIGEERGKAEGRDEEKVEIARNMKRKGYAANDIADLTGLTVTEINRLH